MLPLTSAHLCPVYNDIIAKFGFPELTVHGSSVSLPSGSASFAAIDTGTTLVGGPSSVIQSLYAQIPGSQPGTGNWQNYFTYRTYIAVEPITYLLDDADTACNTQVNVAMSFGGSLWPISPADFQLTQIGSNQCVGGFFAIDTGGSAPNWIVGDTFLVRCLFLFLFSSLNALTYADWDW